MSGDFSAVVARLAGEPGVETTRMFGSDGLKVGGKVFAMAVKGRLVVKLSRERADALLAAGAVEPFDPGHGRPMKQWVAVAPAAALDWVALAEEALACGAAQRRR